MSDVADHTDDKTADPTGHEPADRTDHESEEARALRVARELGASPSTVDRLGGVVNTVLRVRGDDVDWVVRSPVDPHQPDEFPVEQWAVEAARSRGVPVPEVLHVGVSRGVPVMVSRYVQPAAEPVGRPWWWLGRHASSIADADLTDAPAGIFSRFGRDLDRAWAAHLDYNQRALGPDAARADHPRSDDQTPDDRTPDDPTPDDLTPNGPTPNDPTPNGPSPVEPIPVAPIPDEPLQDEPLQDTPNDCSRPDAPPLDPPLPGDPLLADGAYRPEDLPTLRRWLHELDALETSHGLVHGDLAPRNLVSQGAHVAPVLLDWGTTTTGPVPWSELQRSFHAVVVDRQAPWSTLVDLADGMGVLLDTATQQTLVRLTALRLLDLARWARDRRPDLYPSYRDACASGLSSRGSHTA